MKRCLLLLSIVLVLANADHDLLGCLSERDQFVTKDVTGLELDLAPGKMTCEEFLVYGNSQGYFAYAYCLTNPDFKRVCCNTCKSKIKNLFKLILNCLNQNIRIQQRYQVSRQLA